MKRTVLLISFLGMALWASITFAEVAVSDNDLEVSNPSLSGRTAMESTYEDTAGGEPKPTPVATPFVQPDGELSTFGILAVGLVGLFWIRRNASKT